MKAADELVKNGADALGVWRSVEKLARKIANRFPPKDRDDLMQEFYIVTDGARHSWDGTTPFANYVAKLMEYRARTYYRELSPITARGHFLARKYSKLLTKHGENREAIRREAGWSERQLDQAESAAAAEAIKSMDNTIRDGETEIAELIPDPGADGAFVDAERERDRAALKKTVEESLTLLPEKNRRVMVDRYGLMGAECLGVSNTAKKHGMSVQAVATMVKNTHKKMMMGEKAQELTEYFNSYLASRNLYNGTGITRFLRSGASSVEMAILMAEQRQRL